MPEWISTVADPAHATLLMALYLVLERVFPRIKAGQAGQAAEFLEMRNRLRNIDRRTSGLYRGLNRLLHNFQLEREPPE